MKFSEVWLREWVDPELSSDALAAQLTMAGLEVDAIEPVAGEFSGVVIGKVLEAVQHPDADKLRVCQVDVGTGETLQIVCGAANVRTGLHVAAALVGAVLPANFKIKKAKLRGVESFGMLCSASELGLAESSEGLIELPGDSPVGTDLRTFLSLNDVSIELGLTPNRGDCLSIAGIARETAVLNRLPVERPAVGPVVPQIDDTLTVTVQANEDCPRYLGRVIRGVRADAPTPIWMQERLRRSGVRSLSAVVDVTNYVLLELGQPMHAFDLAKVEEGIVVRKAIAGEQLGLLNGTTITLDAEALVIADQHKPLALAGIMGGAGSAVSDTTRDIFLESAFFAPTLLAGRARRYGLHTDSSHRFERGVAPDLANEAMERATALLLEIAGGQPGPIVESTAIDLLPQPRKIILRAQRVERVLGVAIAAEEIADVLRRLGCEIETEDGGWQVVAPVFRFDLAIEEDLIEEVARVYGYNRIPSALPVGELQMQSRPERHVSRRVLRQTLVERGYQEIITYSFVEPRLQRLLDPQLDALKLANPISQDMSVMRTNLWPGLVQTVIANSNRQQPRLRLFENGLCYRHSSEGLQQIQRIGGIAFGTAYPEQWGQSARRIDFFDLKGDVENLLAPAGLTRFSFEAATHPALHPGQTAQIRLGDEVVGWLGALHPQLEKDLDLNGHVYLFELDLAPISSKIVAKFDEISRFPSIRRDLALVMDRAIPAARLLSVARSAAPDYVTNLKLFDVYEGERIDSGRKSIAMGLTLQAQSRTLTDEDVESAVRQILTRLEEELGATIRE